MRAIEQQKAGMKNMVAQGRGTRAYQENVLATDRNMEGAIARVMALPEIQISEAQDTDPGSPTFGEWLFTPDVNVP